mgnify:FL=1|tara:strand:+ start:228 stop:1355 length:1128 start_codon:yes stop_codon:yes gene_type:complete
MGILTRTIANNLGENPNAGINYRNFLINGSMVFFRRGQSFSPASGQGYTADRWMMDESTDGAVTVSQTSDVPAGIGIKNALKIDVTTADTSIAANKYCGLTQYIEGQNMTKLNYGTANAENMMLSFWVKSNKTGIYCVRFVKEAGDETRYETPIEYTINVANTWEKKNISLSPTAGGTALITASAGEIKQNANAGFRIQFTHAVGSDYQATNNTWVAGSNKMGTTNSVNLLDSTSNEWYLTGVQLEMGTSTNAFEHLPEDVELLRCMRYYQRISRPTYGSNTVLTGVNSSANNLCMVKLIHPMRAAPTISQTGTAITLYSPDGSSNASASNPTLSVGGFGTNGGRFLFGRTGNIYSGFWIDIDNDNTHYNITAEL